MWEDGEITVNRKKYTYLAKVYDLPSQFGINNGRVSKLFVYDSKENCVLEYDRGWNDKQPEVGSQAWCVMQSIVALYDAGIKE